MQEFKILETILGDETKKKFHSEDKIITLEISKKVVTPTPITIPDGVWDIIDERYTYIAMNKNNDFIAFEKLPVIDENDNRWKKDNGYSDYCFSDDWVNIDVKEINWRMSLTKRPYDCKRYANGYLNSDIWKIIDERFKYMAIDKDGSIFVYENKPRINYVHNHWVCEGGGVEIEEDIFDIDTDNIYWENSLIRRP